VRARATSVGPVSLDRLAGYVSGRSQAWYAATAPGAAQHRRGVLRELVLGLAALGGSAGTGQPPGAVPPTLGDHALADQLLVLGQELDLAPRDVAAEVGRLEAAARSRL
jgi:hypothetical protein